MYLCRNLKLHSPWPHYSILFVHHRLSTVRLDSMQFPRTIALLSRVLLGRHDENMSLFHSPDVEAKNFLYLIECSLCEFDRRSVLALYFHPKFWTCLTTFH